MNILNVSVGVAASCFLKQNVFYTEQGQWIDDKTETIIVAYHATIIGNETVLSRCECQVNDLELLVENKYQTDDDSIAMALHAVV